MLLHSLMSKATSHKIFCSYFTWYNIYTNTINLIILFQHLHIFGKRIVSRSKEGRHPLSAHCCILPDHDLRCLYRSSNEKAVEKKRKLSLLYRDREYWLSVLVFFFSKPILGDRLVVSGFLYFHCLFVFGFG